MHKQDCIDHFDHTKYEYSGHMYVNYNLLLTCDQIALEQQRVKNLHDRNNLF